MLFSDEALAVEVCGCRFTPDGFRCSPVPSTTEASVPLIDSFFCGVNAPRARPCRAGSSSLVTKSRPRWSAVAECFLPKAADAFCAGDASFAPPKDRSDEFGAPRRWDGVPWPTGCGDTAAVPAGGEVTLADEEAPVPRSGVRCTGGRLSAEYVVRGS